MDGFIITQDNLTIVFKNTTYRYNVPNNLGTVVSLLKSKKYDRAIKAINKKFLVESISNGAIKEKANGDMKIGRDILPDSVKSFVNRLIEQKKPVDGIVNL
jgi:H2-forming N5,N10-methylenetetrahydromethanopterin dehydrogenase-like enzyme